MDKIIKSVESAVKKAGEMFCAVNVDNECIIEKGYANYVTQVDISVQNYLVEELNRILPDSSFICEESDQNSFDLSRPTWIIDPVDGTTNFMYGHGHSAISLALYVDGKPYIGIIYNPERNEMFFAQSGKGAFLNHDRIYVSNKQSLDKCLIGFGTAPYMRDKANMTFNITYDVFMKCRDIRRCGAAALDIAYVACGRLDGYFELNLQPWDYAAGILILEEAGGKITNWKGHDMVPVKSDSIIASNGLIHEELYNIINK